MVICFCHTKIVWWSTGYKREGRMHVIFLGVVSVTLLHLSEYINSVFDVTVAALTPDLPWDFAIYVVYGGICGIVCWVSGRLRLDLFFWQSEQQFLSFLRCGRLAWPAKRHLQQLDRTYSVLFRWPRKQKRWPERRGDRGGGREADRLGDRRHKAVAGRTDASPISSIFFFSVLLGCRLNGNDICDGIRTQLASAEWVVKAFVCCYVSFWGCNIIYYLNTTIWFAWNQLKQR